VIGLLLLSWKRRSRLGRDAGTAVAVSADVSRDRLSSLFTDNDRDDDNANATSLSLRPSRYVPPRYLSRHAVIVFPLTCFPPLPTACRSRTSHQQRTTWAFSCHHSHSPFPRSRTAPDRLRPLSLTHSSQANSMWALLSP